MPQGTGTVELAEAVRRRRMVRAYRPDVPVPHEVLHRLLDHALRAPSAGFSQGRDFVVLTTAADRQRFWVATADPETPADAWLTGMRTAPALVLCLSDPQRYRDRYAEPDKARPDRDPAGWPVPYWDVDTGMAAMSILLTAVDEGLGACFFGVPGPRHDAVLTAFGVPPDRRIVGVISLGLPATDRRSPSLRRGRRPFADVVHDGCFGTPFPARPGAPTTPTGPVS